MIRRFCLVFTLVLALIAPTSWNKPVHQAEAAAVVAAAVPAAAIGALELLALAAAGAALIGIISASQNADFQRQVDQLVERIANATGQALEYALQQSLRLMTQMAAPLGMLNCAAVVSAMSAIRQSSSSQSQTQTRGAADGECRPDLRGSPFACCGDFMRNIRSRAQVEQVGQNAFRIFYIGRHNRTHRCCFEWDSMHGRFEVYEPGNHRRVNHRGERACARQEDLDDDICTPTFPDKVDPTGGHDPRSGC